MSSFLHAYARTHIVNQTKWHRQAFRKTLTYIYVYFDDICLSDRVTALPTTVADSSPKEVHLEESPF